MSDSQMDTRDTSWVTGCLAEHFTHFPGSLRRVALDGRYNLPESEEEFQDALAEIGSYMGFRRAKYNSQHDEFTRASALCQQQDLNAVGVVVDYATAECYNVVVYDDGTVEGVDGDDAFDVEYGVIVL